MNDAPIGRCFPRSMESLRAARAALTARQVASHREQAETWTQRAARLLDDAEFARRQAQHHEAQAARLSHQGEPE